MVKKYYIDACIWMDYFENRSDKFRPLGDWAFDLIKKIIKNEDLILYSELIEEELGENYSNEEIEKIFSIVPLELFVKVKIYNKQLVKARELSKGKDIPLGDAIHAILSRDSDAIMVTRDEHFEKLRGIISVKKPEELI